MRVKLYYTYSITFHFGHLNHNFCDLDVYPYVSEYNRSSSNDIESTYHVHIKCHFIWAQIWFKFGTSCMCLACGFSPSYDLLYILESI